MFVMCFCLFLGGAVFLGVFLFWVPFVGGVGRVF